MASPSQPSNLAFCVKVAGLECGFGSSTSIVVPFPAFPAESAKLQTSSCPFLSPKVDRTRAIARGPMSPFFRSTVEPISTSLVSFFRIEVLSSGTMEPAPAGDPEKLCVTPVGTAVFPPHAEVAKSAPAISISSAILKVGILNLAPNAVMTKPGSKMLLSSPARASDRRPPFKMLKFKKLPKVTIRAVHQADRLPGIRGELGLPATGWVPLAYAARHGPTPLGRGESEAPDKPINGVRREAKVKFRAFCSSWCTRAC